jgi:hypothetical protein
MPKVKFAKSFKFSPDGSKVVEYTPGEHEVNARCAQVAQQAGVLEAEKAQKAPAKAKKEPKKSK